jgi:hypothetical protein
MNCRGPGAGVRAFVGAVCIVLLVWVVLLALYRERGTGERMLLDFEFPAELELLSWNCHTLYSLSSDHATRGTKSLRMDLYPSDYPGLVLVPAAKDWRHYRELLLDIFNPASAPVRIGIRMDDTADYPIAGERYKQDFILAAGMNHLSLPFETLITSGSQRRLNLGSMQRLFVFLDRPQVHTTLYLDALRLIK